MHTTGTTFLALILESFEFVSGKQIEMPQLTRIPATLFDYYAHCESRRFVVGTKQSDQPSVISAHRSFHSGFIDSREKQIKAGSRSNKIQLIGNCALWVAKDLVVHELCDVVSRRKTRDQFLPVFGRWETPRNGTERTFSTPC
jgi:hypothetical protein